MGQKFQSGVICLGICQQSRGINSLEVNNLGGQKSVRGQQFSQLNGLGWVKSPGESTIWKFINSLG